MLHDLDVQPGHRVLDVGAGTGWTTGLVAAAAGSGNAIGVEVDADLAEAAAGRLHAAGVDALVIAGDGDKGWPAGAPYDRVQATFAVRRIPPTWLEQSRPGGVIVAPWGTRYSNINGVARLTVDADGTASGRFTRPVEFMLHRGQRGVWPLHQDYVPGSEWPPDTRESKTNVAFEDVSAAEWQIGVRVPDVVHTVAAEDDGLMLTMYGLSDRSWAFVFWCADGCGKYDVFQGGPRSLWDEVEDAHRWWVAEGRPDVTRFGLTVAPDGQQVWLDSPQNVLLPGGR
jgi:protein-L-isoaspartate O-methyltransferase